MVLYGFTSRNIPNPKMFADVLSERMEAKRTGDKPKANALKLVANTSYGASLNRYNALYDARMGRSVCITGQLFLLELAMHLLQDIPDLKVVQLNTDGIMFEFDDEYEPKVQEIVTEWQERTGFTLEEDKISKLIQKDVSNYIEIATDGSRKVKGEALVRGISTAGAFKINNNAPIVAKAITDYLADETPPEETIRACDEPLQFALIAKVSHKYKDPYQMVSGEQVPVQMCNRVYATDDLEKGTLYKVNKASGRAEKVASIPAHCIIDNDNKIDIKDIDKDWYISQAKKTIADFLPGEERKVDRRKLAGMKRRCMNILARIDNGQLSLSL